MKATNGDLVPTPGLRDGQIDMKALLPLPSWGTPTYDEIVTVRGVNGKPLSFRVVVMPDVPRRDR